MKIHHINPEHRRIWKARVKPVPTDQANCAAYGIVAEDGRILFQVNYWPESQPSCLVMERALADWIRANPQWDVEDEIPT